MRVGADIEKSLNELKPYRPLIMGVLPPHPVLAMHHYDQVLFFMAAIFSTCAIYTHYGYVVLMFWQMHVRPNH